MPEIQLAAEISSELVEVWTSPELVERLIALADIGLFEEVRTLFEQPLEQLPEYLLLTITKCQFATGCHALLDELLTSLMTTFLSTHPNSLPVLKKLWDFNKDLLIRGVCELCNHKNKEMNMSKVLDLSPEIKDSLIKIVYCQNYDFAVNLGVLAGKREFLHYDVWLKERIKQVGKPFVHALIRYLNHNVLIPCREHMIRSGLSAS